MWTNLLFFIFTSHRGGTCSHRGGNVLTAVGMYLTAVGILLTAVGILLTAVGSIPTAVRTFSPRWEQFPPSVRSIIHRAWKHSHRGGNVLTAVRSISTAVGSHVICDDTLMRATISCRHASPFIPLLKLAWNTVKYTRLEYGSLPSSTIKLWVPTTKYHSLWAPTIKYTRVWAPTNKVWVTTTKYHSLWAPTIKYTRVWLPIVKYTRVWAPTIKYN